jgi:uncharacterized protein YcbX
MIEIGHVCEIARYPVKSMAGTATESAVLGWHGLAGDLRCVMMNFDPETGAPDPRVMKTVVRLHKNNAGVYATVVRSGTIHVGDRVSLSEEPVPHLGLGDRHSRGG